VAGLRGWQCALRLEASTLECRTPLLNGAVVLAPSFSTTIPIDQGQVRSRWELRCQNHNQQTTLRRPLLPTSPRMEHFSEERCPRTPDAVAIAKLDNNLASIVPSMM
jgi:hypothetical protein